MIDKIRAFFNQEVHPEDKPSTAEQRDLATAALMIEIATVDDHYDERELETLQNILREQLDLDDGQLQTLNELAHEEQEKSTSLFEFTTLVNEHFSAEEKYQLTVNLWRVAYADGNIDKYEEYLIRRISELIYVAHSDFIRAKQAARPETP